MSVEVLVGLLFIATIVSGESCDNLGTLLYEDLGCTPEYGEPKSYPIKYSCTGLEASSNKCHFRGKTYVDGQHVEDNLSAPSCDKGCFCSVQDGKANFICAILDCAEWLGAPVGKGCYRKYSLDQCCSSGQVCPPFDNIAKCAFDGKEYREGEKFSPKNTCLTCVCKKGFTGKLEEPFCMRRLCGAQLKARSDEIQNGCAPFYGKDSDVLCCPEGWICPDGSEKVEGDSKRDDQCKFGGKILKVGQRFEKSNVENSYGRKFEKVSCECVIPPLVTCKD